MSNVFRQIEGCYKMLEMLQNNNDSALYSVHCGDKEAFIDTKLSDEITSIVKNYYKERIEKLHSELK